MFLPFISRGLHFGGGNTPHGQSCYISPLVVNLKQSEFGELKEVILEVKDLLQALVNKQLLTPVSPPVLLVARAQSLLLSDRSQKLYLRI